MTRYSFMYESSDLRDGETLREYRARARRECEEAATFGRSIEPHGRGAVLTARTRRNLAALARWYADGTISYGSGDTGLVHGPARAA